MAAVDVRLGLDASGPYLASALWSPDRGALATRATRLERDHAARFVPELEALLAEAGASRDDLSAITVGVGPGSYTGLRVGIAAARGLATALSLPLGGVDSLSLIAWGGLAPGETGVAALDARRGNVYAGLYHRDADRLTTLAPPAKRARTDVRAAHPQARWLENEPPDALWAAMRPPAERDATAVYL